MNVAVKIMLFQNTSVATRPYACSTVDEVHGEVGAGGAEAEVAGGAGASGGSVLQPQVAGPLGSVQSGFGGGGLGQAGTSDAHETRQLVLREAAVCCSLSHPNVVATYHYEMAQVGHGAAALSTATLLQPCVLQPVPPGCGGPVPLRSGAGRWGRCYSL